MKRTKSQMGRRSRNKGHNFERDISNRLRVVFPEARRLLEYNAQDANGVDLQGTAHFRFQCKKLKTYASVNTIDEIQCSRDLGEVPVLVTAADNKPAMAILSFDDFLDLIRD